eukprot:gene2340-8611_t
MTPKVGMGVARRLSTDATPPLPPHTAAAVVQIERLAVAARGLLRDGDDAAARAAQDEARRVGRGAGADERLVRKLLHHDDGPDMTAVAKFDDVRMESSILCDTLSTSQPPQPALMGAPPASQPP